MNLSQKLAKLISIKELIPFWKQPGWKIIGWLLFIPFFGLIFLSWQRAVVLLGSMVLHELFHGIIMQVWMKARFTILPIFPYGAMAMPRDAAEKAKSDQAPWFAAAWFTLIGPYANLLLIIIGAVLAQAGTPEFTFWGNELVFINTQLALLNLLPFGTLDGGQFAKIVYSSLKEEHDRVLAWGLTLLGLIGIALLVGIPLANEWQGYAQHAISRVWYIIIGGAIAVGFWQKQDDDNESYSASAQAMSVPHVFFMLVAYFALTAATLWLGTGALW